MKIRNLLIAGLATALLCGCSSGEKSIGGNNEETPAPVETATQDVAQGDTAQAAPTGYYLTVNDYKLAVDQPMETVIASMGKEESYFEAPACAFDGVEKIYTYNNGAIEVRTYIAADGKDYVNFVVLKNDLVSTDEGLSVGDNTEKVKQVYGEDYKDNNGSFEYTKGNMKLLIVIEEDAVVSIQYISTAVNN